MGVTLVRRLHLFYLNRMLRMLPLLATAVILDASLFHKIADGPYWTPVATNAERCRIFWWTTLLHLQNYLNPRKMCVPHSWYVALDIQLHILSPVLLFWLLNGRQQTAWSAVVATLAVAMGASAIYNCALELPSHTFSPSRDSQLFDYMTKYYFHVMSRITPFLVGMAFGYLLHLWRRRIVIMNKIVAVCLWALTFLVMGFTLYMLYRVKQLNWNNQAVDTALNILMRPAWAAAVGWMVLACVHGYGAVPMPGAYGDFFCSLIRSNRDNRRAVYYYLQASSRQRYDTNKMEASGAVRGTRISAKDKFPLIRLKVVYFEWPFIQSAMPVK